MQPRKLVLPELGGGLIMSGKATEARPRQRLSPDARRNQIIDVAVKLFATEGFDASTRDVARDAGISQSLVFNYFASKEDLVRAVYERVYLDRWKPEWDATLEDRSLPLEVRLNTFYASYVDTIFDPDWMRMYLQAGLKSLDINKWYMTLVEERVIKRLCRELRFHYRPDAAVAQQLLPEEIEAVWTFHSGIFYHVVRREIFQLESKVEIADVISASVSVLIHGAKGVCAGSGQTDAS